MSLETNNGVRPNFFPKCRQAGGMNGFSCIIITTSGTLLAQLQTGFGYGRTILVREARQIDGIGWVGKGQGRSDNDLDVAFVVVAVVYPPSLGLIIVGMAGSGCRIHQHVRHGGAAVLFGLALSHPSVNQTGDRVPQCSVFQSCRRAFFGAIGAGVQ
jgi:hypothetical protein